MNNIDKIGRSALEGYSEGPPPLVFKSVRKKVLWFSLWNLGLLRILKVWWPAVIVPIAILVTYQFTNKPDHSFNGQIINERSLIDIYGPEINQIATTTPTENLLNNASQQYATPSVPGSIVYVPQPDINSRFENNIQADNIQNNESLLSMQNNNEEVVPKTNLDKTNHSGKIEAPNSVEAMPEQILTAPTYLKTMGIRLIDYQPMSSISLHQKSSITDGFNDYRRSLSFSLIAGFGLTQSVFGDDFKMQQSTQRINPSVQNFLLMTEVEFGHIWMSSGFQYGRINADWQKDELLYNEHLTYTPVLVGQSITYDSVGYWHYTFISDSIIHVSDSVWAYDVDSTVINNYDTIQTSAYDTLMGAKAVMRITSFEMPFVVGFRKQIGSFDFRLGAGLILGRQLSVSGNLLGNINTETGLIEARQYIIERQWTNSWILTAHIRKAISERFSLGLNPYYRKNFSGFEKVDGGKSTGNSAFGINFILNYNLF